MLVAIEIVQQNLVKAGLVVYCVRRRVQIGGQERRIVRIQHWDPKLLHDDQLLAMEIFRATVADITHRSATTFLRLALVHLQSMYMLYQYSKRQESVRQQFPQRNGYKRSDPYMGNSLTIADGALQNKVTLG